MSDEITQVNCADCGTTFGMETKLWSIRKKDGCTFYCPNGHKLQFTDTDASKNEKLKKELQDTKAQLEEAKVEIRTLKCEILKLTGEKSDEDKSWLEKLRGK